MVDIATGIPPIQHRYLDALPELAAEWSAADVPAAELVVLNEPLAAELGFDPEWLRSDAGVAFLVGASLPDGVRPLAMAYAGHQFGGYSPRLGDGRALLLGEVQTVDGGLADLHLKGSGRTPFARGGDGKATIGPMLREYVMCEAMHALGVPTTRALAVVRTGEDVLRASGPEPGAVFIRTASSHLRVGTFEYAARLDQPDVLVRLADYAIERHGPSAQNADANQYVALLDGVVARQAELVAQWMSLGFIHGVMNTDNTTISGETIDYGPCAFMDQFDPATVFSSIDHGGRYAYGNQPRIMSWNLARLAETLLPLLADDQDAAVEAANEVLGQFGDRFARAWQQRLNAKLGLGIAAADDELADEFMETMQAERRDWTSTFRSLSGGATPDSLAAWAQKWAQRRSTSESVPASALDDVNPIYIPRNHLVEEALGAAVVGDTASFDALCDRVTQPFVAVSGDDRYAIAATDDFTRQHRTFCGT